MSWQSYVDSNLVGTGNVSQASIFGLNGGVWATSPGFQLQPSEVSKIIEGFKNSEPVIENGIHIAGEKYFTLLANERSIY
ncbi:profilin, required for normal timing of actin polymerization in response to thermal stress, partial [Rhizopus stolonifer]